VPSVRPAAVAGMFYPGTPAVLGAAVRAYLAEAKSAEPAAELPKALLVPHAGYVYSGPVAAPAYRRLAAGRRTIRRVVLLGPVHRVPIRGLALPSAEAFATPLGTVEVDTDAAALALAVPQVARNEAAHALEHSLEVQLPFLQTVLEDFRIVPFAVGDASAAEVAAVIERLWGGPETLIVVSSDLSHYHPYEEARQIDRGTAAAILALDSSLDHEQACGATPFNGFALCARRWHLKPELIDLRNSGDTAGDKARVVGYAAFAFTEPRRPAPQDAAAETLFEAADAR
jgi:AmmeMemoRadiSam system protein B